MSEIYRVPDSEIQSQLSYLDRIRELHPKQKSYHIVTLGCQMNVRDSETVSGFMNGMGFSRCDNREDADIICYITCCVRENAENKALGNVIWLKELKKKNPDLIIMVGGCMMQEEGLAGELIDKYPFIDLIFGTHNLYRLPELMYKLLLEKKPLYEIIDIHTVSEGLPVCRSNPYQAFVNIMYGCNNFCSYCIVPYVRGRERSRRADDILDECKQLHDSGIQEITLLGQNVNSYMGGGSHFAELLYRIDQLEIPRVRFMTSHPKDLSDELIDAYGSLKHLMPHLHLPVQAGSDRILQMMNRRYTREKYTELVGKLRKSCPNIGLTSDIIVGFPTETLDEFEETMSLVSDIRFDAAYTFIYSPRPGTAAAKIPDDTPESIKSERIQRLITLQLDIGNDILREQIGKVEPVLVESISARDDMMVGGKTPRSHMVNFAGSRDMIGKIVPVRITSAGKNTLRGELIK